MTQKTEYTGIDKHPGLIAAIVTIVIGVAFIGGLYLRAQGHEGGHGEAGEHAVPAAEPAAGAAEPAAH